MVTSIDCQNQNLFVKTPECFKTPKFDIKTGIAEHFGINPRCYDQINFLMIR